MPEVADIFLTLEVEDKLDFLSSHERRIISDIINCRTETLGGNAFVCDSCGHTDVHYNSCRNRHCPKCQSLARLQWVSAQLRQILPVPYFHAVFTIPDELKPVALYNKKIIYDLLFYCVHKTLSAVAKRDKNLGVSISGISVLHTWDQKLAFHPHIHCILPGGGLSADKTFWKTSSDTFFLSVKKLSLVFRGIFLRKLEKLYQRGVLKFGGALSGLKNARAFKHLLRQSCLHDWVVYLKAPFAGPEKVFQYLGKYTHRVGISNQRIISFENNTVVFSYEDRKDNNVRKLLTLDAQVFAKRFLLHVLPSGFVKIRYFGFLANCVRNKLLPVCKELIRKNLGFDVDILPHGYEVTALTDKYQRKEYPCPQCGKPMRLSEPVERQAVGSPGNVNAVSLESG